MGSCTNPNCSLKNYYPDDAEVSGCSNPECGIKDAHRCIKCNVMFVDRKYQLCKECGGEPCSNCGKRQYDSMYKNDEGFMWCIPCYTENRNTPRSFPVTTGTRCRGCDSPYVPMKRGNAFCGMCMTKIKNKKCTYCGADVRGHGADDRGYCWSCSSIEFIENRDPENKNLKKLPENHCPNCGKYEENLKGNDKILCKTCLDSLPY